MYRVCIADDEPYIRKGIALRIEKVPYPFLVVGIAQTGDAALELYRREKPDLFFLDIRMPGMDGLEVIETIRKEDKGSKTKFVIISGYDDFAYMQQAIHVNVDDYLKKPIRPEEFMHTLQKIYEKMEEEQLEQSKKMMKSRMLLWRDFYEVQKHNEVSGSFLLFHQKNVMNQENIWNLTARFPVEQWKYLWFYSTNDVILLYSKYKYTPEEVRIQVQNEIRQKIYVVYYAGEGMLDQILSVLEDELNCRLYPMPVRFYVCEEQLNVKKQFNRQMLEMILEEGQLISSRKLIENVFTEVFDNTRSIRTMAFIYREILTAFANVYSHKGLVLPGAIGRLMQPMYLANYETKEKIIEEFLILAEDICMKVEEQKSKSEVVDKVIQYIEEHYNEDLSLTSLANEFFLAPTYLARKFKNKTNQSVMHFLEEYRLDRAEEMLRDSLFSITEVANRCGYSDPNYFSRVFRKVKGKAPKDCRL